MIDFSLGKLLLITLIALIVLGPEKLPGAARTLGAVLRRARGSWDSVRAEVERELQLEELRRTAREVAEQGSAAKSALDTVIHDMRKPAQIAITGLEQSVVPDGDMLKKAASEAAALPLPSSTAAAMPAAEHVEKLS